MVNRAIIFGAALAGGLGAAQFPAFSQQYTQRLGGTVDALETVVADFDRSAGAAGLSRDAALAALDGTDFLARRQSDMLRSMARLEHLQAELSALEAAGPFMRAYHLTRQRDFEVARGALAAFEPSLPLGLAGVIFGGTGFVFAGTFAGLVLRPVRKRQRQVA